MEGGDEEEQLLCVKEISCEDISYGTGNIANLLK